MPIFLFIYILPTIQFCFNLKLVTFHYSWDISVVCVMVISLLIWTSVLKRVIIIPLLAIILSLIVCTVFFYPFLSFCFYYLSIHSWHLRLPSRVRYISTSFFSIVLLFYKCRLPQLSCLFLPPIKFPLFLFIFQLSFTIWNSPDRFTFDTGSQDWIYLSYRPLTHADIKYGY